MPKILYDVYDLNNVLGFINNFTADIGVDYVDVDDRTIEGILAGMRQDFPHSDGQDEASPFKKAANFLCYFVAERPILSSLPETNVGKDIHRISNHQNSLIGFMFVRKALEGASLTRNGEVVVLKNKIQVSRHSLADIVHALSRITPDDFPLVSVFLEQLVYKTNPDCQYPVF